MICSSLQRFTCISHGYAQAGEGDHFQIIFSVTAGHELIRGDTQTAAEKTQCGFLRGASCGKFQIMGNRRSYIQIRNPFGLRADFFFQELIGNNNVHAFDSAVILPDQGGDIIVGRPCGLHIISGAPGDTEGKGMFHIVSVSVGNSVNEDLHRAGIGPKEGKQMIQVVSGHGIGIQTVSV